MLFDRIKKIHEAFKMVTSSLNGKADKADVEKINRSLGQEVEKITNKITEINKTTDVKIKNIVKNFNSSNPGNKDGDENLKEENTSEGARGKKSKDKVGSFPGGFEFDEAFVQMTKEMLDQELGGNEKIKELNEFAEEYKEKVDVNKSEIDKIFESIVEIRRGLFEGGSLKADLNDLQDKLNEVEDIVYKQRAYFEDRLKNLEGDGSEEQTGNPDTENKGVSLKDNVKNLNNLFKGITEKIEKVQTRQDNMNGEILGRVKKDLTNESTKILTEFKGDLKESVIKIENQLREKVDKYSLDELGRKVDDKMSVEMNKKIDKNDMKKNNNMINKKIDTLENKISKTLVDTLIDLQMEEAPMIVKKSYNCGIGNNPNEKEKCLSCNQIICNSSITKEEPQSNNVTQSQAKFKFKNVQENCFKYGAGSYSRYLNSIDNAEDLKFKNIQLPDITVNRTSRKFNSNIPHETKFKNKFLEEASDKNYGLMINEELEKKLLNPDLLIKTANKAFENSEKEKKSEKRDNKY